MYRANSRVSPSNMDRQRVIEDRALKEVESLTRLSRERTANTNTQRAANSYSSSKGSFVANNILTASLGNKERRQLLEHLRTDNELDRINEESVRQYLKQEEKQMEEFYNSLSSKSPSTSISVNKLRQRVDNSRARERQRNRTGEDWELWDKEGGGYAKITKVGLLTRIMNIKKKAKAAKPTVRKAAKPVKKPVARKPVKPTARKAAKPVKPVRRKPTIVRRK